MVDSGLQVLRDKVLQAESIAEFNGALKYYQCSDCRLCREAWVLNCHDTVPIHVRNSCDVLVVGDYPEWEEIVEHKLAFSSVAGRMARGAMAELTEGSTISYEFTYVTQCYNHDQVKPSKAMQKACSVYLQKQIELAKPLVILALGKAAAEALVGVSTSISMAQLILNTQNRQYMCGTTPVVITYHPKYLLKRMHSGLLPSEIGNHYNESFRKVISICKAKKELS